MGNNPRGWLRRGWPTISGQSLIDKAVTAAKIDDKAVTEGKLGDKAVTEGKLGDLAVTSGKIGAGAVTPDKLAGGFLKVALADGTDGMTDVTVAGMAIGDELVAVLAMTTKAAITTMANRTAEYVVGAGKLVKAAGTDETNNQLFIIYLDLTA